MDNPDTVERAVMVCPQCEGEGYYADGLDEAACSTDCTRCGTNGWIVNTAAIAALTTPTDGLGEELAAKVDEIRSARRFSAWISVYTEALGKFVLEHADTIITALRAAQPTERAEPWGYGWYENGGKKMALGYLPTIDYPRSESVSEGPFPLYRAIERPTDTPATESRDESWVSDLLDLEDLAEHASEPLSERLLSVIDRARLATPPEPSGQSDAVGENDHA